MTRLTWIFLLLLLAGCRLDAQTSFSRSCKEIFANHYTLEDLDKFATRDLVAYTEDFIECHQKLPEPANTMEAKLARLKIDSEINACISTSYSRALLFLKSKGLQWEFLTADKGTK